MSVGKICVFFLHGSGSSGADISHFLNVAALPEFEHRTFRQISDSMNIDIITPTARTRPYSAFGGMQSNVWYDRSPSFMALGLGDTEDRAGVDSSISTIIEKVREIEHNYDHIFIGGFSMGGGLALHALRQQGLSKLRGLFSLGSFLVHNSAVFNVSKGHLASVPVLMMHGDSDCVISCHWGRQTASNLLLWGADVQFRTYRNVDHELDVRELSDLLLWIEDVLTQYRAQAAADFKPLSSVQKGGQMQAVGAKERTDDSDKAVADGGGGKESKASLDSQLQGMRLEMRAEEKEQERRQAQGLLGRGTVTPCSSTGTTAASNSAASQLQYTIEAVEVKLTSSGSSSSACFRVRFAVPSELVGALLGRPVLACGSTFDILADPPHGVQVEVQSPDPHSTAQQIGLRLLSRISGGSASLNPCPVS